MILYGFYPGINTPDKIIVHHSTSLIAMHQAHLIDGWHEKRDFPKSQLGFFIGYHYVIEKDGTVLQARLVTEGGAHTVGQNFSSIGICLAGNFDIELPTVAQERSLAALIDDEIGRWHLDSAAIYPHRAFAKKDCYGTRLSNDWARDVFLRNKIGWLKLMLLWIKGNTK